MSPLPFAAVELAGLISLCIGIFGIGGLIFTALRFRRDDTTAIVSQQDVILKDMKVLNEELRTTASDLREQRDALQVQVEQLTAQVAKLSESNG
jgi:hypothetical protein